MAKKKKEKEVKANSNPKLAYVTKASDDYWYKVVHLNSIESIFNLIKEYKEEILIEEDWSYKKKEDFDFWDGMKEEDIPKIIEAKYHITIHDDYLY